MNFDGTGLAVLTEGDGTHTVQFSPDQPTSSTSWSRVDLPPVNELRRTADGKLVCKLEEGDARELLADGLAAPRTVRRQRPRWRRPTSTAIIHWPTELRPTEEISGDREHLRRTARLVCAQSHSSGLWHRIGWPRAASSWCRLTAWARPTARRNSTMSAGRNLGDAGFPDRILWLKAAAAKYPCLDLARVGIYGTSAGGQSALAGVAGPRRFLQGRRGRLRLP